MTQTLRSRGRGWYWQVHGDEYERKSVEDDVESFCGWDLLLKIVKECENTRYLVSPRWPAEKADEYWERLIRRDQALIATMFETGGRVIEVLKLRKQNFEFGEKWIRIKGMSVMKRFKRDKQTGETKPILTTRGKFSIPLDEPLVPYMVEWVKDQDDYIFPSPKLDKDYLSTVRAYQIVNSLGERLEPKVHLYDHWFRAQRACQLAEDLNFTLLELMDFFGWKDIKTALRYAKLSTEAQERKMRPGWFEK